MSYKVVVDPNVYSDINKHIKSGNKKLAIKTISLIDELAETPRNGTG